MRAAILTLSCMVVVGFAHAAPRLVIQEQTFGFELATDPSGRWLAMATLQGLKVYSLAARALVAELPVQAEQLSFAGDGRWLQFRAQSAVVLLDLQRTDKPLLFSLLAGDHAWVDLRIARRSEHGAGLRSRDGEYALAAVRLDPATGKLEEAARWPVPFDCQHVAVDDAARVAVVRCKASLVVADLSNVRPVRTLPLDEPGYEPFFVSPDQAWALVQGSKGGLRWVELATGRVVAAALPTAGEVKVAGLFGPGALAVVLQGKQVLGLQPRGVAWQRPEDATGVGYDESRRLLALASNSGLRLKDLEGHDLGFIGSRVVPLNHLVRASGGKLYASASASVFSERLVEVDLAQGELRALGRIDPRVSELLTVSDTGRQFAVRDPRTPDRPLPITGLDPDAATQWGQRTGPGTAATLVGKRLALVDLQRLAVTAWLPWRHAEPPTCARQLPSGELLLLRSPTQLEVWDVARGALLQTHAVDWPDTPVACGLRSVAQTRAGRVLLGTSKGLLSLASPRAPKLTALSPETLAIDEVQVDEAGGRVALGLVDPQFTPRVAICPWTDAPLDLGACKSAWGFDPALVKDGRLLAWRSFSGLNLLDTASGELVASAWLTPRQGSFFTTPQGLYKATPDALDVAVQVDGSDVRLLQEVDLERNQPAAVLERIGVATPAQLAHLRELEGRRRAREQEAQPSAAAPGLALTAAPVPYSAAPSVTVTARLVPGCHPASRLLARVNGIPLGGRQGQPLKPGALEQRVELPLGRGENRVSLSVLDDAGHEGRAVSFIITGPETGTGQVFLLAVGVSEYADVRRRLTYPAKDVRDVAEALRWHGARELVLTDGEATRAQVLAARKFLAQARFQDTVLVYLAGHGLLDSHGEYRFATSDFDFEHPDAGGLSWTELEGLLDGLDAGARVMFLDSCHAGADERASWRPIATADGQARGVRTRGLEDDEDAQGGAPGDPLSSLFVDLRHGTGATILAAAGQAEFAFEDARVSNGLFTHAVLESLRSGVGARAPGELWLEDLLRVVQDRVLALSGNRQRPNLRVGNVAFRQPLLRPPPLEAVVPQSGRGVVTWARSQGGATLALFDDASLRLLSLVKHAVVVDVPLPALPGGYCKGARCEAVVGADGRVLLGDRDSLYVLQPGGAAWTTLAEHRCRWWSASPQAHWLVRAGADGRLVVDDVTKAGAPVRGVTLATDSWQVAWADEEHLAVLEPVSGIVTTFDVRTGKGQAHPTQLAATGDLPLPQLYGARFVAQRQADAWVVEDLSTGAVLRAHRDTALLLLPETQLVFDAAPVGGQWPVADASGALTGALPNFGPLGARVHSGDLLATGAELVLATPQLGLSMAAVDRSDSLVLVFDAARGTALGWFGLPVKYTALLRDGPGTLLVLDTTNGALWRATLHEAAQRPGK